MTWLIGDSFDPYNAITDAGQNFWTTSTGWSLGTTGRFAGSQCFVNGGANATSIQLGYTSGSNDVTHHLVFSLIQTTALGSATNCIWFTLYDGTTAQCSVVLRGDGSIILTTGASSGAALGTTYSSAFAANVWNGFEIEITINNTTGAWHVRKNGNTSDDHADTSLNTRGGTSNNYANKIGIGTNSNVLVQKIDDFLWFNTTGSVPNTWVGDIRSTWQAPNSNSSQQFAPNPNPVTVILTGTTTKTDATGTARYTPFIASYTGTVGSIVPSLNAGFTGNCKMSIFDNTGSSGAPGTVLGSATNVVNPVTGNNTFTFGTPVNVTQGSTYYFGVSHDVTAVWNASASIATGQTGSGVAYASFPSANPTTSANQGGIVNTVNITPTLNYQFVNEAQEDGTTTYVSDTTVGHADLYGVTALVPTPATIIGVQTRLFGAKSDVGARTGEVQLQSGTTTVNSTLALASSFQWIQRVDTVDPNTSSAWTASAVNAILVGPEVNS